MLFSLALISSFVFSQEMPREFSIHRVEAKNQAIIASRMASQVKVGEEFTVETPYGDCHVPVTKVIEDYFYIDTQQCQTEFISQGTMLHSSQKVKVEAYEPAASRTLASGENSIQTQESDSEFVQKYIKNKASVYLSYYTGNSLNGSINQGATSVGDFKGSNAIGFGADYKALDLPYSLSLLGGFAYALPRSYGSYFASSSTNSGRINFDQNPEIQMASLFVNLRYEFNDKIYGVFGVNRLFTQLSKFEGEMTGDFGFHMGARYYPTERLKNLFVDGDINFYNMNYKSSRAKADFSLTELEVKAGYTF